MKFDRLVLYSGIGLGAYYIYKSYNGSSNEEQLYSAGSGGGIVEVVKKLDTSRQPSRLINQTIDDYKRNTLITDVKNSSILSEPNNFSSLLGTDTIVIYKDEKGNIIGGEDYKIGMSLNKKSAKLSENLAKSSIFGTLRSSSGGSRKKKKIKVYDSFKEATKDKKEPIKAYKITKKKVAYIDTKAKQSITREEAEKRNKIYSFTKKYFEV